MSLLTIAQLSFLVKNFFKFFKDFLLFASALADSFDIIAEVSYIVKSFFRFFSIFFSYPKFVLFQTMQSLNIVHISVSIGNSVNPHKDYF